MVEAGEVFTPQTTSEEVVEDCLSGGLQTALESVSYTFGVNNISRACTHQLVRTRVGAGFSQQSMRWCDVSNFNVRIPATILEHVDLAGEFMNLIHTSRDLYKRLVDADVPYEDARFVCPVGTTTHIIVVYNYRALRDLCFARMCNLVQWEIREVAYKMKEEVVKVHPLLGNALMPRCEKMGRCMHQGWESKCGKYSERDWESKRK